MKSGHTELSAVAALLWEGYYVKWEPTILGTTTRTRKRRIKETLFIHEKDKGKDHSEQGKGWNKVTRERVGIKGPLVGLFLT